MRFRTTWIALGLIIGWGLAGWGWYRGMNRVDPAHSSTIVQNSPWFESLTAEPSLAGATIAWVLLDEAGEVIDRSPLAETAMCPASVLKTVTTAAAMEILGPEFRFETFLKSGSAPIDGVLTQGLVLVGGGDPTLADRDLSAMALALAREGITAIHGPIVVDASVFPDDPMNDHWNWGDIGNAYGAGAYGLNLNHNRFEALMTAGGAVGDPTHLAQGDDPLPLIHWRNLVTTGAAGSGDGVVAYSEPYGRQITLRGTIPLAAVGFPVRVAIPNPPETAGERLKHALEQAGIEWMPLDGWLAEKPDQVVLHRHASATLEEIVTSLHHTSNNLEAQCLFLEIGRARGIAPHRAIQQFWEEAGLSFRGLRLLDGSGLARANRIRPIDLARVNWTAAHRGTYGQRYLDSLIRREGIPATRSKNGGMSGVRTEVGFVAGADGQWLTFALMANGLLPGADFNTLHQRLLARAAGMGAHSEIPSAQ